MDNTVEVILEQMFLNKNSNFMFEEFPENVLINEKMINVFINNIDYFVNMDEKLIDELSDFMLKKCIQIFLYNNQYLNFDSTQKLVLKDIYINLLRNIEIISNIGEDLLDKFSYIIYSHHESLKEFLLATNKLEIEASNSYDKNLVPVVCSEYSADFQLAVLGIDIASVIEPVLDLGCGRGGNLVKYLRKIGVEAYGIEREIDEDTSIIKRSSWFDYNIEEKKWGTIISNMAFSNHFFHITLTNSASVGIYKDKFFEIISGLKIGGSFIYAPGLDFIENNLGLKYEVLKYRQENIVGSRLYATHIKRLVD